MRLPRVSKVYLLLAVVLVATVLFRVPSLMEPPWYDDEGIYAAFGHALVIGAIPYRDVLDSRPPGIYWLYAWMLMLSGYSVFFVKLIATLSVLLTQVTVFFVVRRMWSVWAALVTIAALGLIGSFPLFEGNIANAEIFMMLPIAIGMLLIMKDRPFWAGIAFALALLIKQIAGVELAACVVALALFHPRPLRTGALVLLGCAIPLGATLLYLFSQNALADFVYAGFGYYLGYVQREARIPGIVLAVKVILLGLSVVVVWWISHGERSTERFQRALIGVWLAFALFGALFTSRPYPHYLLQALTPLVLLVIPPVVASWNRHMPQMTTGKLVGITGMSIAACSMFLMIYMPWPNWARMEKSIDYYQNFAMYVTGQRTLQAYNDFFDRRVNRNLTIASFVKKSARSDDRLLVLGEDPWMYPLTRLPLATPYVVYYYAYEMPSGVQRVVDAMSKQRPEYVMWTNGRALHPDVKKELDKSYTDVLTVGNAIVYQRTETLAKRLAGAGGGQLPVAGTGR